MSRVGVSRHGPVCLVLKLRFKNVFQKNVSITLCIFGVETVGQIPIRGVLWVRTLDFQLSDDRVHPNAGGCRFQCATRNGSGVGVSTHDPVSIILKLRFKNVFQKNVSITIFVIEVKNVHFG